MRAYTAKNMCKILPIRSPKSAYKKVQKFLQCVEISFVNFYPLFVKNSIHYL